MRSQKKRGKGGSSVFVELTLTSTSSLLLLPCNSLPTSGPPSNRAPFRQGRPTPRSHSLSATSSFPFAFGPPSLPSSFLLPPSSFLLPPSSFLLPRHVLSSFSQTSQTSTKAIYLQRSLQPSKVGRHPSLSRGKEGGGGRSDALRRSSTRPRRSLLLLRRYVRPPSRRRVRKGQVGRGASAWIITGGGSRGECGGHRGRFQSRPSRASQPQQPRRTQVDLPHRRFPHIFRHRRQVPPSRSHRRPRGWSGRTP
ncbi:hypothetical protein BDY24DRAFT_78100 [Mrakia frigida]|uniref:uncharacterized protein n=1 Tax=Mrakia frigida TaxID=29902 RepID=UPI003FCC0755